MVVPAREGIDLFKIAGRSISGWVPSFKVDMGSPVKQPFCSQLEERLLLWLEYHPQVKSYTRGDIGPQFAATYRLLIPKHAPFAISYTFEGNPHDYLSDVVGTLQSGKIFIAEAGMEDDKRGDRNLAKAEAARRLAGLQQGVFWDWDGADARQGTSLQPGVLACQKEDVFSLCRDCVGRRRNWSRRSHCFPGASCIAFNCGSKPSRKSSTEQNNSSKLISRFLL